MKWPFCTKGEGMGHPPVIYEDLIRSRCPVTGGVSGRMGEQQLLSAEWQRCWACKTSSCRHIIFTTIIIFSVSLDTWCFVFWVYILVSCSLLRCSCCSGLAGRGSELAAQRDPHSECLWWLKFGASCKDLVLGNKLKPRLSSRLCYLLIWERAVEEAACFQSSLAAFASGWYVGRLGLFFFPP